MTGAIVRSLAEANVGDTVWIFDSQAAIMVDGKYRGRGVWSTAAITGSTKQSFILPYQGKFDRKTGYGRARGGYQSSYRIAGEAERENERWMGGRGVIASLVQREPDIEKVKQVAAIVGWEPGS